MAQDFYDTLQVYNYIADRLDNNKAALGLRSVARQDERLVNEYPAVMVSMERPLERQQHATQVFRVVFNIDLWIFHAELTRARSIRSADDIVLATSVRKFLHSDYTLGGHIIFGFVDGEFAGVSSRAVGQKTNRVMTTRLTWVGENRVPYGES